MATAKREPKTINDAGTMFGRGARCAKKWVGETLRAAGFKGRFATPLVSTPSLHLPRLQQLHILLLHR